MNTKNFRHKSSIQIRFNDLDILGHVNNAVYQHYFDLARLDYFSEVIGKDLDWKIFGLIMAGISIDYFHPVKISDEISVYSRVENIGDKSLTMIQEITGNVDNEIKASNRATMVGYSMKASNSIPIPELWKERILHYENHLQFSNPLKSN